MISVVLRASKEVAFKPHFAEGNALTGLRSQMGEQKSEDVTAGSFGFESKLGLGVTGV